jgi:hypothetical protein
LRHYTPPATGTVEPLLHIVPSTLDIERLIPMTPELVTVLLAEPHLFSRPVAARHEVLSRNYVRTILIATALTDNGEPIHFTPHDFRRLFTTELVGAGLPLHIAAALLGHPDLDTIRGYTAVFPEQVNAAHHKMVEHRRILRDFRRIPPDHPGRVGDFEQHPVDCTMSRSMTGLDAWSGGRTRHPTCRSWSWTAITVHWSRSSRTCGSHARRREPIGLPQLELRTPTGWGLRVVTEATTNNASVGRWT